jgi:hypothetical protein
MKDEYIRKADAVEETLKYIISSGVNNQSTWNECVRTIADTLQDMPSADVAPVVRCENCIHWSDSNQCARPELSGNRWHDAKYFDTLPDDYCSYGERKE